MINIYRRLNEILCEGIYATAALSEKLCQLKRDNPDDELFAALHTVSEESLFLLAQLKC